jgi:hypothetical protein
MSFRLLLINIKYRTEEDFQWFLKPEISNLSSLGIDINDKKAVINSKYSKIL